MLEEIDLSTVTPGVDHTEMDAVAQFLASHDLDLDGDLDIILVARHFGELIGCAALAGGIVKCVAVAQHAQGLNLLPHLMTELSYIAHARGHAHLFVYTKPRYQDLFTSCGFHPIVAVPDQVVMMENTPRGIRGYTEDLRNYRRIRDKVGAVVLNANPFTKGHQHLLREAARDCDYLHVFVVAEDASYFPFTDRLALVRAGVAEMSERDHIHVHPGTTYVVSKATFPSYFLKDSGLVDMCATAVDLLIFREHIAPALGVTHRYVGTEPFCRVTRQYNTDMHYWLERRDLPPSFAAPVQVVEIPRVAAGDEPGSQAISATNVRRLLELGDLDQLRPLVPDPTFALLAAKYAPDAPPPPQRASTRPC
ncbi:[citrate (pro-3S)-lyase] ligase [Gephyromycinifex aptenodytis]|uniref:[citrate (pro-3S)-lyase] ligase n=1 Tax=Gephyromycinifex aptenodytis TaxID=2716227 RepID=UPI001B2FF170|nr:[citrate (pro-3S)-lyase] ligase [Gephyromycinifex aptenodytis]